MSKRKLRSAASRRGRNNRAKGAGYERTIAKWLHVVFPEAKRTIGQARTGAETPDVDGTPYWIEAGKGKTIVAHKKFAQALRDRRDTPRKEYAARPIAVFTYRGKDEPHLVTMDFWEWLELARSHAIMALEGLPPLDDDDD